MITEKIGNVVARVNELQHLVTPGHWGVLANCVAELEDAAEWAENLEAHCAVDGGPKLRVIDFTRTSEDGKTGVNLTAVAAILEDVAEALLEADGDRVNIVATAPPSDLRLLPCDNAKNVLTYGGHRKKR